MQDTAGRAIAIVGVGAILPDAPNAAAFWKNVKNGRYSISEVSTDRWDPALHYDEDHNAPDKTYSKIGGWVRDYTWEPAKWHLPVPPRVVNAMDEAQKWAICCTREALTDYGFPERPLNLDRTAVILGNAMAGEKHYMTAFRVLFPEYIRELSKVESFAALPQALREEIARELHRRVDLRLPEITEDSMPGELANCIAGRLANVFNFHGPNFVTDAACASAMAAISAAAEGLADHEFDVALTGGIDRNMGASTFVKFCKIGALSATGTRPYAEGADGFVMGEGAALFLLKRLADAEQSGDKIYAVIRGVGGSSDGKGKGITAPNPVGQKFCLERAWRNAGLPASSATYFEGHGTSTRVGDVVEVQSLSDFIGGNGNGKHPIWLGSVKSNIGHLKGGAGAAGILKTALALHEKVLPPSLHCDRPNPDIDFSRLALRVNTKLQPWDAPKDGVRRAGVSAFGFGGTNFHAVLEEYVPGWLAANGKHAVGVSITRPPGATTSTPQAAKAPLRGALVVGAKSVSGLIERLRAVLKEADAGRAPAPKAPAQTDLQAAERIAIDYADAADLKDKAARAIKAIEANQPAMWRALRTQGVFRGHGPAPKVAFMYTGQGSQYGNMLQELRDREPIVAETFAEADEILTPLLGKPLSKFIFVDGGDPAAVAEAERDLKQTAITQPAVLATDIALTRLLAAYGIEPDMTMGHSLGEYGALVAAGGLRFHDALEAVSARGREMTKVSMEDNGKMAAIFAPLPEIEKILATIDGYVVIANINSNTQAVIGGNTKPVQAAVQAFLQAGYNAVPLEVSHAFHTTIVASAAQPLRNMMERLTVQVPKLPIVTNVTGEFYPSGPGIETQMLDILAQQVASPVQFVKGLHTLYKAGARVFVEVGPKKALHGFAEDVLGGYGDVLALFTNHPKSGDIPSLNQALCGLYAAGLGRGEVEPPALLVVAPRMDAIPAPTSAPVAVSPADDKYTALGRLFADFLDRSRSIFDSQSGGPGSMSPVAITGAAVGLPGTEKIFDDTNVARILGGEQFIDVIPTRLRRAILDKHVTRLVKRENGGPTFELIDNAADVIKLAGRGGAFEPEREYGFSGDRLAALDRVTRLAMAVGIDALRDAGIPLVMHYKTTTRGTQLQDRWGLPAGMRDDTGVIFASCWPGSDSFAEHLNRYYTDKGRRERLAALENLQARMAPNAELERQIADLRAALESDGFLFDRRFVFQTLSMGHSQFAEYVGARGPNTQINSACASTTQAIAMAEDWIRAGRCRRVVIIAADDVTSDNLMEWIGAGFLATGAAATDEVVEEAALPFDRRRHGTILGMGAAGIVVETVEAARERGIRPICDVLATATANSAFHGTRLDVQHICGIMENLVAQAESRGGVSRHQMAQHMVFVSHETYTPARGGSAAAEIQALRKVFGPVADRIVIANTKGFTGHPMGAGIEDVVAVKALETGCIPPVANYKEVDPELGNLNLSKGGMYDVEYALRLGAGFGSQISMTLLRWSKSLTGVRPSPNALGYQTRVEDPGAWSAWLRQATGLNAPQVEVVQHTLRVRDQGAAGAPAKAMAAVAQAAPLPVAVRAPEPPPDPAPPAAAKQEDPVKQRILTLVSAKTGYPVDMLDLDLDLEADLGVDTVKQAEVFASIREAYGIQRDENLKLRDFPTLSHVIGFVYDRRPDLKAAPATAHVPAVAPTPVADAVKERVLALVVEKTGYPHDMLDLDLDLEADLGVDTVKQAELFAAIRGIYNIPRDENLKLRDFPTLNHVIGFVKDRRPDLKTVPAPSAVPVTLPAVAGDSIQERVLALVVEKTGYPPDMLDLGLDLEADLGVDTVKQAELFAAIRGIYNIPRDENLKLRDFPTLKHVIGFVKDRLPKEVAASAGEDPVKATLLDIVAAKTGYPQDMLDLDLDLEADLGVDTVKQAEVFAAVRAAYDIPRDENLKLRDFPTLAHVIRFVHERRPNMAPAGSAVDEVEAKVLEIVAQKTGYPPEMLDRDLDLEADLGIDTVKQAETFAAVRAAFDIPRDENLKLRDFPTLAHVIGFARDRRGGSAPAAVAETVSAPTVATFEAADSIPRRVPVPVLRPPLRRCKPTGVSLGGGSRVAIMPDSSGVAEELRGHLESMGVEVLMLDRAAKIVEQMKNWTGSGPVTGLYWLPALDDEGPLASMTFEYWKGAIGIRVKALYAAVRAAYEQLGAARSFLLSATRLGGMHSYGPEGATAPLGGAVTGFTKTFKRERSAATVKAVDFELACSASEMAEILIKETLHDNGAVEIGYKGGQRWSVSLQEQPAADGQPGMALGKDSVVVVTGAAGSIVSAITADLAAASGGTFYLLDLVPEPDPNNPDIARFVSDKDGLKRDIAARIQARGERPTPALIEKELAALERANAAMTAINAVRNAGGTAFYNSVDLRDGDRVAEVIQAVRQCSGKIDVLLHAAGMERSHFLPDKDEREFNLIFDVKADGWFHLLHAIGDMELGATVAFSSIAGRFGNAGQTDYASANDLLCKISSSFRTVRPATRGIAIDWTAWGGIGMATRSSIPKMMELAGIDMLPPEAGVPLIRRELMAGGTRGEVVVAGRLGILLNEWDETGGVDLSTVSLQGPMVGQITGMSLRSGLTIETTLNPAEQPFLYDHRIDGTPVLPGVMGIEGFAEAASALLPGWSVESVEKVEFLAPFKFYRDEPRTVTLEVQFHPNGHSIVAACRLTGKRPLSGQSEPQVTTHFTGNVCLSTMPAPIPALEPPVANGGGVDAGAIYRVYFHGPAYQVLERVWRNGKGAVAKLRDELPPNHTPAELSTVMMPRLLELCFQAAGVWEIGASGRMGLPLQVGRVSVRQCELTSPVYALVAQHHDGATFDCEVVNAHGECIVSMRGYRTVALPNSVEAEAFKALHAVEA